LKNGRKKRIKGVIEKWKFLNKIWKKVRIEMTQNNKK